MDIRARLERGRDELPVVDACARDEDDPDDLAANPLSIVGPLALRPGSGMPARQQGIRGVLPLVFMLVVPLPLGLTLIPLGIEALLSAMNWFAWFPAYLVFGVVQALVTLWLYGLVLDWEGDLLQRREQRILEIVGSRAE